jgi:DNA-binding NarL/FixJ family response regulator
VVQEVVHRADGSFEIPSLPVSVDALRRHAERYGTDGVLEVAEAVLDERAVARLRVELDAIDRARVPRFGRVRTRRRSTVETRAAVLALRADGLVPGVIADKLGVSDATVRRHLKAA